MNPYISAPKNLLYFSLLSIFYKYFYYYILYQLFFVIARTFCTVVQNWQCHILCLMLIIYTIYSIM